MTRVAFYAPLKPPGHPVPSGDREMARNLMTAIAQGGATVDLVSSLRIYDPNGDAALQGALIAQARAEADRLIADLSQDPPDLWVTYHNYYKAPDLLGPALCQHLNLPYVQIESTRATRRLSGPWAGFAQAAERATDAADLIFYFTANDLITLKREQIPGQTLAHLHPFLPLTALPAAADCAGADRPILCAGMMRGGDKLASYHIIAATLALLPDTNWSVDLAGDGPARPEIEKLMAPFGPRVRFLGQLDKAQLADAYANAAVFFWPGVNEAFGLVYLEAQAAGLPIVAQDRPGVRDILAAGHYPPPEAGPQALANRITALLANPALRRQCGQAARDMIARHHLIPAASRRFWSKIPPLIGARP